MPFWESSIFWGITGIVGGFIVAAFFFYIGKARKSLAYQISTSNLITAEINNLPGLKISVGDEPATNLASTTVKFINNGNQTISSSDFASLSPLQITASQHFFNAENIDISYIKAQNKTLNPRIDVMGKDRIVIGFEYLKPKQEFEITVLHDGKLSVGGDLKTGRFQSYDSMLQNSRHKHILKMLVESSTIAIIVGTILTLTILLITNGNLNSSNLIKIEVGELDSAIDDLRATITAIEMDNQQLKEENQQLRDIIKALAPESDITSGNIPDP